MPTTTISEETQKFLKELRKDLNLNSTGEVIDHLVTEMKIKPIEEKSMKEIDEDDDIERNPIAEIKNNKLDFQLEEINKLKETLTAINADISSKMQLLNQSISELKKPNPDSLKIGEELGTIKTTLSSIKSSQDSLRSEIKASLSQREIDSKLEFLRLDLNTANEKLSELMQPPILTPQIVDALTKLKNRWQKNNLSEVVMNLIGNLKDF